MDGLTIELEVVKSKKEINSNATSTEQNKCDLCEYSGSSSTVLKRHVTMKHIKDVKMWIFLLSLSVKYASMKVSQHLHSKVTYLKTMILHMSHWHHIFQRYKSFQEPYDITAWISR